MESASIMKQAYQKAREEGKISPEQANRKIQAYEYLEKATKEDLYVMIDTGYFNDIIKSYTYKALENTGIEKEKINQVMNELKNIFDFVSTEEICN